MKVVVVVSTNFQHCVQAFLLLLEIWNFCITTVQLIIFFPLSFRLFFYRTEKKCRNGSSLPPPQVFPRLSERRKPETTKQQAREEDDGNDRRAWGVMSDGHFLLFQSLPSSALFFIIGSLSSDVLERRIFTGSGLFALLSCNFQQIFGQIVSSRVKALSNAELRASRHTK